MRRYKRKTRKFARKVKKYFKRKYGGRKYSRMGRIKSRSVGMLLPDRLKLKLKFNYNAQLACDSNGNGTFRVTGNDPFDPDNSGTSNGQPTGWDIYTQLYRYCYCSGSKINLSFVNANNDLGGGNDPIVGELIFGVVPGTQSLSNTDLVTMKPNEWPYCKERYVSSYPASNVKRISHYCATKKLYGYKTADNKDFIATTGASPTNIWYWNFYQISPQGISGVGKIGYWRVTITYYIHLFGRAEIPVS